MEKKEISIICLMMSITFFSCTSDKIESGPCDSSIPDTVSFQRDMIPLFDSYCSLSGCHSGIMPQANLNLEDSVAYSQLMKPGKGYVDTLNPEYSVLYTQMNSVSNPMPPTGKLDQCKINLVLKWIQQGAKNN